jgi:hypothetical protein
MNNKRPVKTTAKMVGERASTRLVMFFRDQGWNYRSQEDQNDFGIDAEVEIVDRNLVTGITFKAQVKGTESISLGRRRH